MHVKLGDIDDIWRFKWGVRFIIHGCMKSIFRTSYSLYGLFEDNDVD
jgi:hypothetical protein